MTATPRPHLAVVDPAPAGQAPAGEVTVEALVQRARTGDLDAWSRLYQESFDGLYHHVGFMVGDPALAEDIVQETFAKALAGLDRFDGRSSFHTWARGIALNLIRRHWRSKQRRAQADLTLRHASEVVASRTPEGDHLEQQRARALLAVLETLPEPLREAFVLCDLQQVPTEQAAAELAISPGNLRVRAHRARTRIREALGRAGWINTEAGGA